MKSGIFISMMTAVFGAIAVTGVQAQTFPTKAITLVVPYSTGGSTDLITRLVARELTIQMGRQVNVKTA